MGTSGPRADATRRLANLTRLRLTMSTRPLGQPSRVSGAGLLEFKASRARSSSASSKVSNLQRRRVPSVSAQRTVDVVDLVSRSAGGTPACAGQRRPAHGVPPPGSSPSSMSSQRSRSHGRIRNAPRAPRTRPHAKHRGRSPGDRRSARPTQSSGIRATKPRARYRRLSRRTAPGHLGQGEGAQGVRRS
jgi:hypothetical protein